MSNPENPYKREDKEIKSYPVSRRWLNLFKDLGKIDYYTYIDGIQMHHVRQVDKHSGVEIEFFIYVTPEMTTNFTIMAPTDIE